MSRQYFPLTGRPDKPLNRIMGGPKLIANVDARVLPLLPVMVSVDTGVCCVLLSTFLKLKLDCADEPPALVDHPYPVIEK